MVKNNKDDLNDDDGVYEEARKLLDNLGEDAHSGATTSAKDIGLSESDTSDTVDPPETDPYASSAATSPSSYEPSSSDETTRKNDFEEEDVTIIDDNSVLDSSDTQREEEKFIEEASQTQPVSQHLEDTLEDRTYSETNTGTDNVDGYSSAESEDVSAISDNEEENSKKSGFLPWVAAGAAALGLAGATYVGLKSQEKSPDPTPSASSPSQIDPSETSSSAPEANMQGTNPPQAGSGIVYWKNQGSDKIYRSVDGQNTHLTIEEYIQAGSPIPEVR